MADDSFMIPGKRGIMQIMSPRWRAGEPRTSLDPLKEPGVASESPRSLSRPLDREVARAYGTSTNLDALTPAQLLLEDANERNRRKLRQWITARAQEGNTVEMIDPTRKDPQ